MLKILILLLIFTSAHAIKTDNVNAVNVESTSSLTEPAQVSLLRHDTKKLMSYYSPKAKWWQDKNCIHPGGCIGTEQSVWVWANAAYVMANYQALTGDRQYQHLIKTVYTKNWQHIYPKKYFDDDLWWALALLRVYEVTGDHDALLKAQKLVNYVQKNGIQNICYGYGGIYWNLAKTEVGTIANMLYIIDNAKLYQITHDKIYRQQANLTWNWYRRSGLLSKNYTVFDHYAVSSRSCGTLYNWPFTYNVGVLLAALNSLAQINNAPDFITYGRKVALTSLASFMHNGVIDEYCDDVFECAKNVFLFKGIYAYNIAEFAIATKDPVFIGQVKNILNNNWQTIRQIQRTTSIYAFNWSQPINYTRSSNLYNPADILSHLSVVYLELGNMLITEESNQTLIKSTVKKNF